MRTHRPRCEHGVVFDLDRFVADCHTALGEDQPHGAVREVLQRTVAAPGRVAEALDPREGGFTLLHHAPDLTVLHVVWAPGMRIYPHDHRMWAAIGIYAGQEDNEFFRRAGDDRGTLTASGGKRLEEGDVAVLGEATIHAVTNPLRRLTAAIHVYGGDFVNQPRSQWGPGAPEEAPYDIDEARRQFAAANRAWQASGAGAGGAGAAEGA
jgi:predicted metal-dependent enzyme (double-stranded beta helix superfamily)